MITTCNEVNFEAEVSTPIVGSRPSPEVTKEAKHFLQPILPILGSNESLWNSKTFDMPLTLVSGRMVHNFEFEMSKKQEVAPFLK